MRFWNAIVWLFIKYSNVYMPQFLPLTRSHLFSDQLQKCHRNISCKELLFFLDVSAQRTGGKHYKKLRYREEHSASVMLSWCTL